MKHAPGGEDSFSYDYFITVTNPRTESFWKILKALQLLSGSTSPLSYSSGNSGKDLETYIKYSSAPDAEGFRHVCEAVWRANGGYIPVEVSSTYIEHQPCGTFTSEEGDYKK